MAQNHNIFLSIDYFLYPMHDRKSILYLPYIFLEIIFKLGEHSFSFYQGDFSEKKNKWKHNEEVKDPL